MVRFVPALLWLAILAVAGCAGDNIFQRHRDQTLTRPARAEIESHLPNPSTTVEPQPGPQVLVEPRLPVVVDRSQNQNASLSLPEALELALRNSQIVRVSAGTSVAASSDTFYDIEVSEERVKAALAAFDASLQANVYGTRIKRPPNAFFGPGLAQPSLRNEGAFNLGLVKPLTTGGTASVFYNPDPGYLFLPQYSGSSFNPTYVGNVEFAVTQPVLRGAGLAVNRAPIQIAQISSEQTAWDFKKTAMASVRSVIAAYWDLYAAQIALKSVDEVIPLLEELVRVQEEGYKTEWVIYADVAKAYAQLHDYRQQRLARQSEIVATELRLRHLMGLPPADGRNLIPVTEPTRRSLAVDPVCAVNQAMSNQPDLVRQRLAVRIRELELLVAKNNRLPNLDLRALYRMNGVGDDISSTLQQLATAEYADWYVGGTFSMPLGLRQATAEARAAQLNLVKENGLLDQTKLTIAHDVGNELQRIDYAYRQYREAEQRLRAADDWLKGSRLRYENPNPDGEGNWLLQSLNDYLSALRFRTDAAADAAAILAEYNSEIVRLEEAKGTLLSFFAIDFAYDPCRQSRHLDATYSTASPPLSLPTDSVDGPSSEAPPPTESLSPTADSSIPTPGPARQAAPVRMPEPVPVSPSPLPPPQSSPTYLPLPKFEVFSPRDNRSNSVARRTETAPQIESPEVELLPPVD